MAGHSHWANIAHKKAAVDKKRARVFSKVARKIIVAAKQGGGDPGTNPKLRLAVQSARAVNMSNDQIKRAIQRAIGATDGENYEELVYEGYAPGGAAVLVEALTDNRNRTGGELRSIFSKRGGNLGTSGSVAWQFARKAVIRIPSGATTEDDLILAVVDAGADDVEQMGELFEVRGAPESLSELQTAVADAGLECVSSQVDYVANDYLAVDEETGKKVASLLEALDENDDVQSVYTNAEFPEGFEG